MIPGLKARFSCVFTFVAGWCAASHRGLVVLALIGICTLAEITADAASTDTARIEDSHSVLSLVSEAASAAPGDTIWLGITITPIDGWHSYWKNPGDSGIAPSFQLSSTAGILFDNPLFPTPETLPSGPLTNYGYKGAATFLVPVHVPDDIRRGPLDIHLDAEWLVCDIECVPQGGEASLTVTLGDGQRNETVSAVFSAARAALPEPGYWDADLNVLADAAQLIVYLSQTEAEAVTAVRFFPAGEGVLNHSAPQTFAVTPAGLVVTLERAAGDVAPSDGSGVLVLTDRDGQISAIEVSAVLTAAATANDPAALEAATKVPDSAAPTIDLWQAAIFALFGGVLLNLMPCVFPVLSLKALAMTAVAGEEAGTLRRDGWAYTAGILVSFAAIVAVLQALRAGGEAAGWGFQLQNPTFVGIMVMVMVLIGLSLSGMFVLTSGVDHVGHKLTQAGGMRGAFFTGVLATLVATPCTAPFMGPAIGFALTQSVAASAVVFAALGFGLALPFLILSHSPAATALLPRPGPWMDRFKQVLAFPMYLTGAWLLSVYVALTDSQTLMLFLFALIGIVFTVWLWQQSAAVFVRLLSAGLGAALVYMSVFLPGEAGHPTAAHAPAQAGEYVFDPDTLDDLVRATSPTFVYFTADWCITCKANEKVALHRIETKAFFADHGITVMRGDWTGRDDRIAAFLARFGRAGVPLYLIYPGGGKPPVVLPQLLTVDLLKTRLKAALSM